MHVNEMNVKFVFLLLFFTTVHFTYGFEEFVGKIKSSFQYAGKLLGLDESNSVTKLVSEAFSKSSKKMADDNNNNNNNNIFSGFLRILGLDTKKISAIAVNAIIFVAQLISTSLSKAPPSELTEARNLEGTPIDWIMNNTYLTDMISYAKDESLPNHIIEYVKERSLDEESDCIQLLICKTKPFIWKMQKAITDGIDSKGKFALFANLPSIHEVADHGDACEKKHPYCVLYY